MAEIYVGEKGRTREGEREKRGVLTSCAERKK